MNIRLSASIDCVQLCPIIEANLRVWKGINRNNFKIQKNLYIYDKYVCLYIYIHIYLTHNGSVWIIHIYIYYLNLLFIYKHIRMNTMEHVYLMVF